MNTLVAFSQILTVQIVETRLYTNQGVSFLGREVEMNKDSYLYPTWRNNTILYVNGNKYELSNVNFNISTSSLTCKLNNGKYFVFGGSEVQKFSMNGKLFRKNGRAYFEVLVEEGNTYFYKRYDVRQKDAATHRLGMGQKGASHSVTSYSYLVKYGRESKTIELSKNSILELFSDKKEVLKKYVKDNDLSYKKERDLIKIVRYMLKNENKLT